MITIVIAGQQAFQVKSKDFYRDILITIVILFRIEKYSPVVNTVINNIKGQTANEPESIKLAISG